MLLALAGLFIALTLSAQNHKITLQLQDAMTGEAVGFATVSVTPVKGQAQTKYTLSDSEGKVTIEKVRVGNYKLKAEIMGYKTFEEELELRADANLGIIKLEQDMEVLDAASVSAVGNPIIIKKDTVEYNASSFKISDDNMLVDLLKKLPGIEVAEDGSITSNGETISKITIGGKTFFLDDPQLATQNIPAKLVEKVKVIKKKSEQAEFTGIDDGNDETVIDLSVQKGMMNGLFGNLTAGGGHDVPSKGDNLMNDWRWQAGGMLGRFTEKNQISLILNANNTNNRSFNDLAGGMMGGMMGGGGMMGRGGGGGFGNANGINTSWMTGLNGNTELFDGKMDLGGNYVYNGSIIDVLQETDKETYQSETSTLYSHEDGKSHRYTNGHRFGMRLEHKFSENTSLLFQPQVNFGGGDYVQQSVFNSALNSVDNKINDGFTNNTGNNKNVSTSGFLLLRQRLGLPGRTISLNATWNVSSNKMDGYNQSLTNTYDGGEITNVALVNQLIEQRSNSQSVGGRLVYTEPLGNNFYLEGSYNINWSNSKTTKDAYNHDGDYGYATLTPYTLDNIFMQYLKKGEWDSAYSNEVINRNLNQNIGVAFMYQMDKIRAQLGASAIHTNTYNYTSTQTNPYHDLRWNFAPRAMLFADFTDNFNVRLFYNGRTAQPSTSQLNPVLDNTNPMLLNLGNPHLTPYFSHNVRNEWEYSNRETFFTARLNLQGGMVQNPITNAIWYNGARQYTMPVNGENTYNASARAMINAPIAKSNFSISSTTNVSYSKSGSFLATDHFAWQNYFEKDSQGNITDNFKYNEFYEDYYEKKVRDWDDDFLSNITRSLTLMENLRFTYRSDYVEVIVGARTRVSKPWYTVQESVDATWNNRVSGSFKWTVGDTGLEMGTDASYNWYRGYTTEQPSQLVWNATISKQLFRRQATIALKAYDILNQATNLNVTDTANYHSEVRNNTLGRYVMLTFTWRFGTFGGRNGRMGGGPGNFRGGPPMGGGFRPF